MRNVCHLVRCGVVLVSLFLVGGEGMLRTVSAGPSPVEADRLTTTDLEALQRRLPAGVFPAVARTLQDEGAAAYRLRRSAPGALSYRAENATHGLAADFEAEGVRVSLDGTGWSWGMTLAGYGRRGAVQAVSEAQLSVAGNRAEYAYGEGITAWYVNGRLGLQQGFTVSRRPAAGSGQDELEVRLSLRGDVVARVAAGGGSATLGQRSGVFRQRYGGLYVYDRTGRALPARLASVSDGLSIVVDDRGAQYPLTIDPFIQQAKLTVSDGAANDYFGISVSVSGDTIVIGAYADDGDGTNSGSAYVFVKPSGGWAEATQTAKLTASDGAAWDNFGDSVSVSGDTIVVVAGYDDDSGSNSGSAYVFVKPDGGWSDATQTAKLTASDGAANDNFGESVSVTGGTIVAGAYGDDDNGSLSGSAYVFVKPSGGWSDATQTAKLTASDGTANDHFGISVSVSGDTIVVGAPHDNDNGTESGSAYVFVKPSDGWSDTTQTAKLTASDGAVEDNFGWSVSVSGDTVVVGAVDDDANGDGSGSAYVFEKPSGGWSDATQTAKLADIDGAADDDFGWSVSVSGDTIVVGAPYDDDNGTNSGSAHVYMFEALVLRQHDLDESGGWEIGESEPVEVGWIGSARNDQASSLIVSDGYSVDVFRHRSFRGTRLTYHGPRTVSEDDLSAHGMNDQISSYELYKTPILFYATPRTLPTFGDTGEAETTRQGVNNFCELYLPEAYAARDVVAFLTVSESDTMVNFVDLYDIDPTAEVIGTTGDTIKDSWEALMEEGPDMPIQDATGMSHPEFWSRTYADGSVYWDLDNVDDHSCSHYTSTTSNKRISVGYGDETDYGGQYETGWIGSNDYPSCNSMQHVLCVAY